jgi:UDP-N-acetylglucosamine acyltransferase
VHQHVRIGAHAFIGGMTGVDRDIIPYGSVVGNRAEMAGLNLIGLKRRGFGRDTIAALREAYGMIFMGEAAGTLASRAALVAAEYPHVVEVQRLADFIRADTSRSFCTPRDG